MDLDNGIILETLLLELILLIAEVIRIVGDLLSETRFLTELVGAGTEVITPKHEMITGKVIEVSLALRKAKENTLLKTTQPFDHDPSKSITLVIRTKITERTQISILMNRSSHNTIISATQSSFFYYNR